MTTTKRAPKATTEPAPAKQRNRRTPDQIVADLQAKIDDVQARAAAKEAKQSEEGKAFVLAVKAADKALHVAQEAEDAEMLRVLESARATLGEHLLKMGVRAPVIRGPRKVSA